MGKQSARLYYDGKDHKDIYFQENYHWKMYKGNEKIWEKLIGNEYIANYTRITDIENKSIYKEAAHLISIKHFISDGKRFFMIADSKNHKNGFFSSEDGIYYKYFTDYENSIDESSVVLRPVKNGIYILSHTVPEIFNNHDYHYSMTSYLFDNNMDVLKVKDVFSLEFIDTPKTDFQYITPIIFDSDNIPFAYYSSIENSENKIYGYLYVKNNKIWKANVLDSTVSPFSTVASFCIKNVFYIIYRDGLGSSAHNVFWYNLDEKKTGVYKHVLEADINWHTQFYLNGKAYIYAKNKNGRLFCLETSNFSSFKKTEIKEKISVKSWSGQIVEIHMIEFGNGMQINAPTACSKFGYFENKKMIQKNCILLNFTSNLRLVYIDNMYFEESENNFATF